MKVEGERYTLYQGDCIDVMAGIPDGCIDLTVTSPPYDNLRDYGTDFDPDSFGWQAIVRELYRITAVGGVVVWVVADATINGSETGTSFRQALYAMECGFSNETMIYRKPGNGSPQRAPYIRYSQAFEFMFVWTKGSVSTFNPIMVYGKKEGTRTKSKTGRNGKTVRGYYKSGSGCPAPNVWKILPDHMKKNAAQNGKIHPAQMPSDIAKNHIISWSNPGDIVFDPMMGSGTTGKMAMRTNRRFIGIELDAQYFEIAHTRIANAANDFIRTPEEKEKGQLSFFD